MKSKNGVELPIDIQPSTGSFGCVFQGFFIKENSVRSIRFFYISRFEKNFKNTQDYYFGNFWYNGIFLSKHLPYTWPGKNKGWTVILQVRNELKGKNQLEGELLKDTGSVIFYVTPQINYTIGELWNVSVLFDLPVYQYYYGPQLAASAAFGITLSRDLYFGSMKWY
jgi:hypothetical protein